MKITGEVWKTIEDKTNRVSTKNTFEETRVIKKERHIALECGHTIRAYGLQAKYNTRCYECEPDRTLAQESALRLDSATRELKRKIESVTTDNVIKQIMFALDDLRFDCVSGYKPDTQSVLSVIDKLLVVHKQCEAHLAKQADLEAKTEPVEGGSHA